MHNELLLEPTEAAQWHKLLQEAEDQYGCHLDEAMESYLVFTLMRFMKNQDLAMQAVALDYLRAHGLSGNMRLEQLRDVGDQCLILSGLFPKRAERRLVRVGYYVDIGRSAYHHLSGTLNYAAAELYQQLAEAFVLLMDLLQTIRGFSAPALHPIQAFDLWCDSGSQSAFRQFTQDSNIPLHESLIDTKFKQ